MTFNCYASGSKGNFYTLTASNGQRLFLECGIKHGEWVKALNWDLNGIVGCLVSHCHNDHALSIKEVLGSVIKVYSGKETLEARGVDKCALSRVIEPFKTYKIGDFKVYPIPAVHDVPCLAFVISHPEMGKTLFATDTMMLEYKIKDLSHILIECNYSDEALTWAIENGNTHPAMRQRLLETHMELETTLGVLKSNDLSKVNEIVLLHLSGKNSDPKEFVRRVEQTTSKPTYIAKKGLELEFNLTNNI